MASSESAPCCSSMLSTRCACRSTATLPCQPGCSNSATSTVTARQAGSKQIARELCPAPHLLSVLRLVQVGLEHHVHYASLLQPTSQRLQGAQVAALTRGDNVTICLLPIGHQ